MSNLQADLTAAIRSHVAESPLNCLVDIDGSPIWDDPLVACADGDDPLFDLYKQVVGESHLTPREALTSGLGAPAGARLSVVSWVLPVAAASRLANRRMADGPALRWNHTRFQGEAFNDSLRRYVVTWLQERGHQAVAPVLTERFVTLRSAHGWASTWSERHVAFAAGHGTFGLSDGLITERGVAHRCGSVVTDAAFEANPRPYTDHMAYCPYIRDGSCGACIERCPAGAIGPNGHDKDRCREYLFTILPDWQRGKPGYMGSYGACGLCQTKVPCEHRRPR